MNLSTLENPTLNLENPTFTFGGGGRTRRTPALKLEKIWFFCRKIVIFHTKYPNIVRVSLRSARFF